MATDTILECKAYISSGTGISPANHYYFENAEATNSFFKKHQILEFNGVNVVRVGPSIRGWNVGNVHISHPLKDLEGAEYLSYFNETLSTIWFHNKITSIEYVNRNSSRIHFVPDYYATYIGYVKLGWAFIERGHIAREDDIVNANLIQEPIDVPTPPKVYRWNSMPNVWGKYLPDCYVIFSDADNNESTISRNVHLSKYGGVPFYGYTKVCYNSSEVEHYVKSYTKQTSGYQSMLKPLMSNVMAIKWMSSTLFRSDGATTDNVNYVYKVRYARNTKCFSPQFLHFKVFALSSGEHIHMNALNGKYGVSSGNLDTVEFNFVLRGCGGLNAMVGLYLDQGNNVRSNWIKQQPYPNLTITSFQPAKYTDFGYMDKVFYDPVGRGLKNIITSAATGGVAGAAIGGAAAGIGAIPGALGGAAVGAASSAAGMIYDIIQGFKTVEQTGDNTVSYSTVSLGSSDYANATSMYNWEIVAYEPSDKYLEVLDDYFDRWGYMLSENKKIKLNLRNNFTYIKTIDANVTGNAPQIAINHINSMLNNGCTFWKVPIGSTKYCDLEGK